MIRESKLTFVLLMTTLFLVSCQYEEHQKPKKVFDVDYDKAYDTLSIEKNHGFKHVPIDIHLYQKQTADTITGIVFEDNSNIIFNIIWGNRI